MIKKKYFRLINSSFLFFKFKKIEKIYGKGDGNFENILSSKHLKIELNRIKHMRKNQVIELEFTILPSFRPNVEIIFPLDFGDEDVDLSAYFTILLSKKLTIFFSGSLPLFKNINFRQSEIVKIDIKSSKIWGSDKVFSELYLERKKYIKQENFNKNQKKNFSTKIKTTFLLNGSLKFRNSSSYSISSISVIGFSKNKSLIWYNMGPEFRFNLRK
jgi:hypothetical protein